MLSNNDDLLSQLLTIGPLLINLLTNPFTFVADNWMSLYMLYYLCLAMLPKEDITFLSVYINCRPANIEWATLLMLVQQTPILHIQKAVEDGLIKYECEETVPVVLTAMSALNIKGLQTHIVPNADGSMTLITGTPRFNAYRTLTSIKLKEGESLLSLTGRVSAAMRSLKDSRSTGFDIDMADAELQAVVLSLCCYEILKGL
ncbi:hypothetical protein C8J57DRAFT_1532494 [Mycena rebaudengoi]|nr:hypothetical protein C8J57DRAFT_1532494 [Mycena rebaudengoi]